MKIGFIGLGKMGSRMAGKLVREGHAIVVWNRSPQPIQEFLKANQESGISLACRQAGNQGKIHNSSFIIPHSKPGKVIAAESIEDLVKKLHPPRVIWSMVPAGPATQDILDEVDKFLEKGDIVIDGGNAHFKDTQRRYEEFKKRGVRFLGIGVSGGIIAAETGYPLMVGGDYDAYCFIAPLLDSLAKPNGGHEYFGEGGAGHFVKMVHNGIEYGIMQSLGEGFGVLQKSPYDLDLLKVAKLWQKGTLVSGFMLDRTVDALAPDPTLSNIVGIIEESGEARWTAEQAKEEGVEVEIIERSLEFRRRSQRDSSVSSSFAARMVAALRAAFGGHAVRNR